MDDFGDRYWGKANYQKLLQIKNKYDPDNVFWCRNCVGSEVKKEDESGLSNWAIAGIIIAKIAIVAILIGIAIYCVRKKRGSK